MRKRVYGSFLLILLSSSIAGCAQTNTARPFKAGAAKIDITPNENALPQGFKDGIRDKLYVRSVVIDNGISIAALISVDVANVPENYFLGFVQSIVKETGIPAKNILISPSHTHSSVRLPLDNSAPVDSRITTFTLNLEKSIVEVVKQAKARLQPARVGFNTGTSYLNVNRDVIDPVTRLWTQAPNYDGPSDKTVAVVKFETLKGDPIAVYYNYAMHSNSMFMSGVISADVSGETSRYIEDYYDDKIIALWSMGAAGDQNPRYLQPMQDIERLKSEAALASGKAKDMHEAIMYAGRIGGMDDFLIDPKILARQSQMITSMGQFLGEEILRVMKYTFRTDSKISIYGAQKIVTCPGRKTNDVGREGSPFTYFDGEPVHIKLSMLLLGDIAFAAVNADVYNLIAQRLKRESPLANIMMITHTNGRSNSGYIPNDDAFGRYTFQVLHSALRPGCAEDAIVNGFLDMMDEARK
jgi:hypothetical protein